MAVQPKGKQKTRDALKTFVPNTMKWILQTEKNNMKIPYAKQFPSVALFADISGFTNLTEKLSALPGTFGVEILADEINNYLTLIIKQIVGSGGDVFKFAGDALLCVWPPNAEERENENLQWANLSTKVLRAIRCALDIQKDIGIMSKCNVKELELRVKLGIGVGIIDVLVVGGVMGRFENLPAGQAFFEAFNCENDTPKLKDGEPGPVIISSKAYHMVKKHINEADSVGTDGNWIVKSITYRPPKRKLKEGDLVDDDKYNDDDKFFRDMSRYIPSAVVPHLRMPEQTWVGELRQVTIMFLSLPFNSKDIQNIRATGSTTLKDIHDSIRSLQTIIYRYQGSLNKFLVDDKGSTVMAVFGLPPVAHRNDPERAVMAALDLRTEFQRIYTRKLVQGLGGMVLNANRTQEKYDRDLNRTKKEKEHDKKMKSKRHSAGENKKKKHSIAIGITSGIVYLGLVGGAGSRREYSVLGDKVNLAARLMGLCKKKGAIYGEIAVDESIRQKVRRSHVLDWQFVKKTFVKGKKQEITVYRPIQLKHQIHRAEPPKAWLSDASDKHYITLCSKVIQQLHENSTGRAVVVEGEAGLGKAALIRRVMDQTKARVWWLWGCGEWQDETREDVQFPVWKQILVSFQDRYPFYEEKHRRSFEKYIKKRRPDLHEWLFLLSYFDLISFVSPSEYDPNVNIPKEKKDLTRLKLKGTVWERNEQLVQELKDRILLRMEKEVQRFEKELEDIESEDEKNTKRKAKEREMRKQAETKVDKKIGNYIYDVVICLLEWAGGKAYGSKPIAVVVDGLQWLRKRDWSLTRRLCYLLNAGVSRNVALFTASTPMDIKRYTPHYIRGFYPTQYSDMRDSQQTEVIIPAAWGIQKTKKYVKTYFYHNCDINVRDVGPKLVETVHSQCGGRPGFIKEFLDTLKKKSDENVKNKHPALLQFSDMRDAGEKKLTFSPEFEEFLSSRTQYASIPIPPVIQAITARHLDVLNPEQMICLKTAATICISKGTRCLSFLRSTLMGCHPIKDFVTNQQRFGETLESLCKMKFIVKLANMEDISHAVNVHGHEQQQTMPCQLYTQPSMIMGTQHGNLENHYAGGVHSHRQHAHQAMPGRGVLRNGSMDNSIKGRYGGGNFVQSKRMHNDEFSFGHMRGASLASNHSVGSELEEMKNTKMQHDENKNKFGDNMPSTESLMRNQGGDNATFKRGRLTKTKGGVLNKGQSRVFVFKKDTLYWFRDIKVDKYPLGRIKFDESILRLQRNEKKMEIQIKVSRKKYVLRADSVQDMNEWFTLFQTAMNSDLNRLQSREDSGELEELKSTTRTVNGADEEPANMARTKTVDSVKYDAVPSVTTGTGILEDGDLSQGTFPPKQVSFAPSNLSMGRTHSGTLNGSVPDSLQQTQTSSVTNLLEDGIPNFSSNTGECYEFTHGFLRDAIYEAMLFAQRSRIHKTAQEYLRKVLKAISSLPDYANKEVDTRDYTMLLQRHQAIASNYQDQQNSIGVLINDEGKSKKKSRKPKLPVFIGLD